METILNTSYFIIGLIIFKYCVFNIADSIGMNRFLTLLPIYDIAVLLRYYNIPIWTLLLLLIPGLNQITPFLILIAPIAAFTTLNFEIEYKGIGYYIINVLFVIFIIVIIITLGLIGMVAGIIGFTAFMLYLKDI